MNDPNIIAAAIVIVIAAIGSAVVQVINAWSAANDRREARLAREEIKRITESSVTKTNTLIEKTAEIHTLTNSNLSKVTAALEVSIAKNKELETFIRSLVKDKETSDALAISRSSENPKVLEAIQENTENTVVAVKELKTKGAKS